MQTPDLDNLLKALLDALYGQDCFIWNIGNIQKIWGQTGAIEVFSNEKYPGHNHTA